MALRISVIGRYSVLYSKLYANLFMVADYFFTPSNFNNSAELHETPIGK